MHQQLRSLAQERGSTGGVSHTWCSRDLRSSLPLLPDSACMAVLVSTPTGTTRSPGQKPRTKLRGQVGLCRRIAVLRLMPLYPVQQLLGGSTVHSGGRWFQQLAPVVSSMLRLSSECRSLSSMTPELKSLDF